MVIAAFRRLLLKTFDIRPGEIRRAVLMQLNFFLIISTLLVVKPTVNGLFLAEIGVEKLPLAYLLVAVSAVAISFAYSYFLNRTTLMRLILATVAISIAVFIFLGLMLLFNPGATWFLYAFYVWVSLFGVLTASQFWILANVVFNAREARRLFGFIGAGAIAGGIFGGYLTTILAEVLGSEYLPFLAAGLLSMCVPITITLWKKDVLTTQSKFQRRKKIPRASHPLNLILASSHLTSLAAIIGISVIVARLVDFQFSAIASYNIEDPDDLTAFFGFWFSNFNVISLAIQLLLTRRLVGTLGVGTSLYFLPVLIFFGALVLLFSPLLWAAIFIKLSDGSLKQSINKAAVELLALPVPQEVKNQTKTFIDVVVDSVATGISGLVLIFLVTGLGLSTSFISFIIIVLLGVWLYFIWRIRKSYLLAFRTQMSGNDPAESIAERLPNESILEELRKMLREGDENQLLFVLKKLIAQPDPRLAENIVPLIQHPSDRVKAAAIRNLYYLKSYNYLDAIRPLVQHPEQAVQVAAYEYLLAFSSEGKVAIIEQYLQDTDDDLRLATLIALAEESRDNPVLKGRFDLEKRLRAAISDLESISDDELRAYHKTAILKALGLSKIESLFPAIDTFLEDPDEAVAAAAIAAAGDTLHPYFLPRLIQRLDSEPFSEAACHALRKFGPEIVKTLAGYLESPETEVGIKRKIPAVAEHFGHQAATDLLFTLLRHEDAHVRLEALKSLNNQKVQYPHLNFYDKKVISFLISEARIFQSTLSILYSQRNAADASLPKQEDDEKKQARKELIHLLETRLDDDLERIFRLLGLKYPPQEVLTIFEHIHSPQPDLRDNALEYLENLLEPNLKKILVPLVETVLLDTISAQALEELHLSIP
ncbi:MAG: Npt1/Npt2 family nucleotide transporter [Bacteroidia bacterium]